MNREQTYQHARNTAIGVSIFTLVMMVVSVLMILRHHDWSYSIATAILFLPTWLMWRDTLGERKLMADLDGGLLLPPENKHSPHQISVPSIPLQSKDEYKTALKELEQLWNIQLDTEGNERLSKLVRLVNDYEIEHDIPLPVKKVVKKRKQTSKKPKTARKKASTTPRKKTNKGTRK